MTKPLVPPQLYNKLNKDRDKKPNQYAPASKTQANRAFLDVEVFNELIKKQGVRVQVYKTAPCPNVTSIDGAEHAINCTVCLQNGFIDRDPIEAYVLISSEEREYKFLAEGYYEVETLNITVPSGIELSYFTLIKLLDNSEQYWQLVKKQEGPIDILKYNAYKINLMVDQNGRTYVPGIDFTLTVEGNIQWLPTRAPRSGTIYTINYDIPIQFRAINAIHAYRFLQVSNPEKDGTKIVKGPQKWQIKREYLVERTTFKNKGQKLPVDKIRNSDPAGYTSDPT